jgi:hypothetical protein
VENVNAEVDALIEAGVRLLALTQLRYSNSMIDQRSSLMTTTRVIVLVIRPTRYRSGSDKTEAYLRDPPWFDGQNPNTVDIFRRRLGPNFSSRQARRMLSAQTRWLETHPQGPSGGEIRRYSVALLLVRREFRVAPRGDRESHRTLQGAGLRLSRVRV